MFRKMYKTIVCYFLFFCISLMPVWAETKAKAEEKPDLSATKADMPKEVEDARSQPKRIKALQLKVALVLAEKQKEQAILENKLIEVNKALAELEANRIVTTCDDTKVELTCTKQNEKNRCLATKLSFQPKGMPEHIITLPKEMKKENFYAVGLGCNKSPKNEHYVVVEFVGLPYGCKICEFLYLYDLKGNALTKIEPLFLKEASEGNPKGSSYPNNEEFYAIFEKLGLKWKQLEYF